MSPPGASCRRLPPRRQAGAALSRCHRVAATVGGHDPARPHICVVNRAIWSVSRVSLFACGNPVARILPPPLISGPVYFESESVRHWGVPILLRPLGCRARRRYQRATSRGGHCRNGAVLAACGSSTVSTTTAPATIGPAPTRAVGGALTPTPSPTPTGGGIAVPGSQAPQPTGATGATTAVLHATVTITGGLQVTGSFDQPLPVGVTTCSDVAANGTGERLTGYPPSFNVPEPPLTGGNRRRRRWRSHLRDRRQRDGRQRPPTTPGRAPTPGAT